MGVNLQPIVTVIKLFGCNCCDLKLLSAVRMVVGLNCRHKKTRSVAGSVDLEMSVSNRRVLATHRIPINNLTE